MGDPFFLAATSFPLKTHGVFFCFYGGRFFFLGKNKIRELKKKKINKKKLSWDFFACRPVDLQRGQPRWPGPAAARSSPAQDAPPAAEGPLSPCPAPGNPGPSLGASRFPEARAGLSALSVTKDIAKNDLDCYLFF